MADELGYTLSEDAMRRVAATVMRDERRLRNGQSRRRRNTSPGTFHTALAKTTSSITARSGTTPGSGTATVWERDSSVVAAVEFSDLVDMTIYNASTSAVSSGSYVLIFRDRNGLWWVKDAVATDTTAYYERVVASALNRTSSGSTSMTTVATSAALTAAGVYLVTGHATFSMFAQGLGDAWSTTTARGWARGGVRVDHSAGSASEAGSCSAFIDNVTSAYTKAPLAHATAAAFYTAAINDTFTLDVSLDLSISAGIDEWELTTGLLIIRRIGT